MNAVVPVLRGVGGAVPPTRVSNADLLDQFGLEPNWVTTRTGIGSRHVVRDGMATSDLAVVAGRRALASAGLTHVEMVIVATTTPDYRLPATAPKVAHQLGLDGAAAFDINAVCTGFIYALAQAGASIRSGLAESVLVIGADTFSTITGPEDAVNQAIFGDGAGAFVLTAGSDGEAGKLGSSHLSSNGAHERMIRVAAGGSAPVAPNDPPYFQMEGREVFSAAVKGMVDACRTVAEHEDWPLTEVDWVVPHQANRRIIKNVVTALGADECAAIVHLDEVGNTSAASIPLAITRHHDRFRGGERLLLTAFGGGLTWGAISLTWPSHVMRVDAITMNEHHGRAAS